MAQKTVREWPIWKTVTLGTYNSIAALREALEVGKHKVSDWADDILGMITLFSAAITVDLVRLTVRDLGFDHNVTTADIIARAKELGLALCPAEVGPQLRLQYVDQPDREWLWAMMEPIRASRGRPYLFLVNCNGVTWLRTNDALAVDSWSPDSLLVFCRPRS